MTALRASDSFLSVWSTALRPRLFNAGPSSLLDRRGNVEGVDVSRKSQITIVFLLVINIACGMSRAAAQSDPYPRMAPIDQYLMEKTPRFNWREVPLPIPYLATRRFWYWDGRATRQPLKARTDLSAKWIEPGWARSTGPSSGTRR